MKAVKCSEQRAGYLLCRRVATWCQDHLPSPISLRMCAARVSGFTQRMSALAVTLKAEISRLARKEIRSTSTALSKAVTAHRTQIASLKRRMHVIEAGLRRAVRQSEAAPPVPTTDANGEKLRFRLQGSRHTGSAWACRLPQLARSLRLARRRSTTGKAGPVDRARRCCQPSPRSGGLESGKPVRF